MEDLDKTEKRKIRKLVEELTTNIDREVDCDKLKVLKSICKQKDEHIAEVSSNLFKQVKKMNSDIRLLCLWIFDELFQDHTTSEH